VATVELNLDENNMNLIGDLETILLVIEYYERVYENYKKMRQILQDTSKKFSDLLYDFEIEMKKWIQSKDCKEIEADLIKGVEIYVKKNSDWFLNRSTKQGEVALLNECK
jgi:hypothetical protein